MDRTPSDQVDVCVVGGGIAGGLVAHSLAKRNHDVVVLEAGPRFEFESRMDRMEKAIRPDHQITEVWDMGGNRDKYSLSGDINYKLNRTRIKGVGGTTLHWLGTTPRLHQKDFEMQSRYGLAKDWPIEYEDLRPYYAAAEKELGVAGDTDNPFAPPREEDYPLEAFPWSYVDSLYETACENLGITIHSVPQARNSKTYDNRSECVGFSTCTPVCPSGAKYSGDVHIRKAETEGTRVIDRVPVQYLEHNTEGSYVESAVYVTPDGQKHRQEAQCFVIACGAVETARLLLLSRSEKYPDGLANSSGLVGKYFMEHPTVATRGFLDEPTNQEPIRFFTTMSEQFYDHEEPTPGSIFLQFENISPPSPLNIWLRGGDHSVRGDLKDPFLGDMWGEELYKAYSESSTKNRKVGISAAVEQLPRKSNEITLNPNQTDNHGNPIPDVSLSLEGREIETMQRALDIQSEILKEMNASITRSTNPHNPFFGAHHMGTTRMGNDPQKSVVTPHLRTHDLENLYIASSSVFVTAGAVNPTLTIAALSLRVADFIDGTL